MLLSGSGDGRPGGRPVAASGQKLTVGRSTDRSTGSSFLAFLAANGYIFLGAINTPLERGFHQELLDEISELSLVFIQVLKRVSLCQKDQSSLFLKVFYYFKEK